MSAAAAAIGLVTRSGYRNRTPFGQALRKLLWSNRCLQVLPAVGWMDGGCLILCDALVAWGHGQLQAGATLRRATSGALFMDHAFAHVIHPRHGVCIIDGEGVSDEQLLRHRLERLERVRDFSVHYADASRHAIGILIDPERSIVITNELEKAFGRFDPALLMPLK